MKMPDIHPELQRFVEDQVRSGAFSSPKEVIEAGLARLMFDDEEEMDADTLAAIQRAQDQIKRGEYRPFTEFAAEMRKKYLSK